MLKILEIEAMMRMRHKRIVTFHGVGEIFGPPNKNDDVPRVGIFVLMQLGCGGDLSHYLKNAYKKLIEFPWSKRIQFALDIAEGMEYIHSENFVHRDLKSMNVLLDENGRCMIADLGLTCKNVRSDPYIEPKFKNYDPNEAKGEDSNYLQDAYVGTKCWKAPELLRVHPKYGKKVDVFAFGVVMWEILTCRSPDMHFYRDQQQLENLCEGRRHSIKPDEMPQTTEGSAFLSLLKRCWETEEGRRPNFAEIVEKLQEMKTQIDDRILICNEESK